jgi:hypothetical protein
MKKPPKHPMQPVERTEDGVIRFKANAIVEFLLNNGPFDMNFLARQKFSPEDRTQFAQLIGYSVNGFGELPYVSSRDFNTANKRRIALSLEDTNR